MKDDLNTLEERNSAASRRMICAKGREFNSARTVSINLTAEHGRKNLLLCQEEYPTSCLATGT
jgi:hypothetical protein